jgi:hypothetical protein
VAWALAAVTAAVLALSTLDALGLRGAPLLLGLSLVYLGIGVFVAASYALFMDLSDPRFGATQFSAYMGATNACEAWSGWVVGRGVGAIGYAPAFACIALVSLLGLPLLRALRPAATPRRNPS